MQFSLKLFIMEIVASGEHLTCHRTGVSQCAVWEILTWGMQEKFQESEIDICRWTQSPLNTEKMYSFFPATKLNLCPGLLFHLMKRLVFSQFQVNTISGYNAIHLRLCSSSPLPKWHQRARVLTSDLRTETRHLVLIWKLSTLLPAVVYTVPSGSQLLLFFSAKSAFESGSPTTPSYQQPLECHVL